MTEVEQSPDAQGEEEHVATSVPHLADRRKKLGIAALVLILLITATVVWYAHSGNFEETDDAQIDGHLVPVASRVEGTIQTVRVDDNQTVHAGEVLIVLDPRDSQVAADQAKAQLEQARANSAAANPNVPMTRISNQADVATDTAQVQSAAAAVVAARQDLAGALARLRESQAVNSRTQAEFARYQTLFDKNEVARADYDQRKFAAEAQLQTVAASQAAVQVAQTTIEQRQAALLEQQTKQKQTVRSAPLRLQMREADNKAQKASEQAAKAAYERAMLTVMYGTITSPVTGVVTQRSAEPNAHVVPGQQLLMIVQTGDLWVTANFKETQLAKMHPGQRVTIVVDALQRSFEGTIESMPAITGSRTSVLPPENATGNYVKVVQRMPVRIRFRSAQADLDKLRPGMSVEPKVDLR